MARNWSLHNAKEKKNDEFYTQISDIEKELKHYNDHFSGKTVLCNCDDPYESNFFKYFAMSFNYLGLKKLICTCYAGSPIVYTQLSLFGNDHICKELESEREPYVTEITEVNDLNNDGAIDLADVELLLKSEEGKPRLLKGNGDFRSPECIELLQEADIVVTNPPFSLFREYVAQLMEYNKKFVIIGNMNAITYKEIFPLIKDNKIWLGYNSVKEFKQPDGTIKKFGNILWFTNLDIKKRFEPLDLIEKHNPEKYPKYDNYDAINVDKTCDIPFDYNGVMGVPVSFLDKYCPDQFIIVGNEYSLNIDRGRGYINGKRMYSRIFIKKRV